MLKKFDKTGCGSPEMLICLNFKISALCQTLSKALGMSKKTLLASNPLSKEVKILLLIDSSWLRQKSRGLRLVYTEKSYRKK